jgi:hypothetical protein
MREIPLRLGIFLLVTTNARAVGPLRPPGFPKVIQPLGLSRQCGSRTAPLTFGTRGDASPPRDTFTRLNAPSPTPPSRPRTPLEQRVDRRIQEARNYAESHGQTLAARQDATRDLLNDHETAEALDWIAFAPERHQVMYNFAGENLYTLTFRNAHEYREFRHLYDRAEGSSQGRHVSYEDQRILPLPPQLAEQFRHVQEHRQVQTHSPVRRDRVRYRPILTSLERYVRERTPPTESTSESAATAAPRRLHSPPPRRSASRARRQVRQALVAARARVADRGRSLENQMEEVRSLLEQPLLRQSLRSVIFTRTAPNQYIVRYSFGPEEGMAFSFQLANAEQYQRFRRMYPNNPAASARVPLPADLTEEFEPLGDDLGPNVNGYRRPAAGSSGSE